MAGKGTKVGKHKVAGVPRVTMGSRPALHCVSHFGNKVAAKGALSNVAAGGHAGKRSTGKSHFGKK